MTGPPDKSEAAAYYFRYIDRVPPGDVVDTLESQLGALTATFAGISEEQSLRRYAPDKWSIRQLVNHVSDTERLFTFRALWFSRGFQDALPSFEQDPAVAAAKADAVFWARHVEEFRAVRQATVAFFRNLPAEGWGRGGVASGNPVTVRALAYIMAGHADHHASVLRERYLRG